MSKTISASYSLRAWKEATVSMPLKCSEIKSGLKMSGYTLKSVPNLMIKRIGYFNNLLGKRIDVNKAIKGLNDI